MPAIHSRSIKCQSRLSSQRGTEVNGSHHGDNRYSDQQGSKSRHKVMRLYKQCHRPISKRIIKPSYSISRAGSIDSDCCRLPKTSVLSNKADKLRSNQFLSPSPSFSRPHIVQKKGKLKYRGPWWCRPCAGEAGARASIQPSKALCMLEKAPRFLPVRRSLWSSPEEK